MPADRLTPNGTSAPITGAAYMDEVAEEIEALWNATILPLIAVGGSANALTANLVPPLTGALAGRMAFWLVPIFTNTGAATLSINGAAPIDLRADDGRALPAGALAAGRLAILVTVGSQLRVYGSSAIRKINTVQVFTATGTWSKPAGTPDDALVTIECWGGGGGGGPGTSPTANPGMTAGGGGGGAYCKTIMRAADIPSTLSVVVGDGGAPGLPGGTTGVSDGVKHVALAYGGGAGGGGGRTAGAYGGGGAGGSYVGTGGSANWEVGGLPAGPDAGRGGSPLFGANPTIAPTASTGEGGGGGGYGAESGATSGQASKYGGGGGAGSFNPNQNQGGAPVPIGGASLFGGAGGAAGANGQPRGGGGGARASGGRGEVIIRVNG